MHGDENAIVDLLNLSFEKKVTDIDKWNWRHTCCPQSGVNSVFIIEAGEQLVGHRETVIRHLNVFGNQVSVALMGSTAIRQDFRGCGLYSRLHKATLQKAASDGASLAFTTNAKGSVTYKNNLKTGFIEIDSPMYIRIVNHHNVLVTVLRRFVASTRKARALFDNLKHELSFGLGEYTLSVAEILGEGGSSKSDTKVQVLFSEKAIPLLLMLREGGRVSKVICLLRLVLTGKVRIKASSPITLLKFMRLGVKLFV